MEDNLKKIKKKQERLIFSCGLNPDNWVVEKHAIGYVIIRHKMAMYRRIISFLDGSTPTSIEYSDYALAEIKNKVLRGEGERYDD